MTTGLDYGAYQRNISYFDDPHAAFDMPHALRFIRSRGQKTIDKYMMFLDRLKVNNMIFSPYDDHRKTRPFEEVCWYSR